MLFVWFIYRVFQTICFCIYTLFKKIQHSKSVWFSHCISHNISQPANRLSKYQNSFFPSTIKTWNTLDLNIREVPTFFTFKKRLQFKYFRNKKIPCYFSSGDRYLNVLQSRLRNRCSALNDLPIDEFTLLFGNEILNDEKNTKIHSRHRSFHNKLTTVWECVLMFILFIVRDWPRKFISIVSFFLFLSFFFFLFTTVCDNR